MSWLKKAIYKATLDEILEKFDTVDTANIPIMMRGLFQARPRLRQDIDDAAWQLIENKYHTVIGSPFHPTSDDIVVLVNASNDMLKESPELVSRGVALAERYTGTLTDAATIALLQRIKHQVEFGKK